MCRKHNRGCCLFQPAPLRDLEKYRDYARDCAHNLNLTHLDLADPHNAGPAFLEAAAGSITESISVFDIFTRFFNDEISRRVLR